MKFISVRSLLTILVFGSFFLGACSEVVSTNQGFQDEQSSNSNSSEEQNENDQGLNVNEDEQGINGNDGFSSDDEIELTGLVDAISDSTVTVDGVEYNIADFTEFKDLISVGDEVEIHVVVDENGNLVLLDVEIKGNDDSSENGNTNSNSNDDDDDDEHDDNGNDNESHGGSDSNDNSSSGSGGGNSNDDD